MKNLMNLLELSHGSSSIYAYTRSFFKTLNMIVLTNISHDITTIKLHNSSHDKIDLE